MRFIFNPKLFNPLYWHLISHLRDIVIRFIFIEGGSSASKTFTICQALVLYCLEEKKNVLVFRRFHVHIKDTVYASFRAAIKSLELTDHFIFQEDLIRCKANGARIVFKGLDNEENIKGIDDFDIVYNNEWNQFLEAHWKQQRKRLRGKPNQKFICDWNPVSSKLWNYEKWIDLEQWIDLPLEMPNVPTKYSSLNSEFSFKRVNEVGNSINIKVTYRDNHWIVGHPSGKGGFYDTETIRDFNLDRDRDSSQYRIYANGERGVIRTGGEFWKQFNSDRHVKAIPYLKAPIHVTLDENVNPYVTVSIWQVAGKEIKQVHEIPCRTPDNNAVKAAGHFIKWMERIGHQDMIFVYGDPSASRRSTVDVNNSSFYDKFIDELKKAGFHIINRVGKSAPQVALSASFVNEIYEVNHLGYSISISDSCKVSIDDYLTVKEAPDGTMLKTKVKDPDTQITYEPNGHFSDAKRYFLTELLKIEFNLYKSKRRRTGSISV